MQARKIFFDAVHFVPKHISFAAYYFLLMALSELLQWARSINMGLGVTKNVVTLGENQYEQVTDWSEIIKGYIPEELLTFLKQPSAAYVLFVLLFVLFLVFVGITFIIQALLRKRDASVVHETVHSFHALMRAPWALVYFLAIAACTTFLPYLVSVKAIQKASTPAEFLPFFGLILLFLVIGLALFYMQQLLYDNYHSLTSVLHTSWEYLKKSYLALLKFYLNIVVVAIFFILVFLLLAAFIPMSLLSVLQFLIKTYLSLVVIVGVNMIYLHVRSES